ncbi:MAG: hypothetical protein R3283_09555 [Balneolaceae bacterium]|nr:hypothetical protein [Balneolaceae bacterium]
MKFRLTASIALLILSFTFLQSCGLFNSDGDGLPINIEHEFMGVYAQGIEDSWFYPCDYDYDLGWKPEFTEDSFGQLQQFWESNDQNFGAFSLITIRGVLSKKGSYSGFFARYEREIEILEILSATPTEVREC